MYKVFFRTLSVLALNVFCFFFVFVSVFGCVVSTYIPVKGALIALCMEHALFGPLARALDDGRVRLG